MSNGRNVTTVGAVNAVNRMAENMAKKPVKTIFRIVGVCKNGHYLLVVFLLFSFSFWLAED